MRDFNGERVEVERPTMWTRTSTKSALRGQRVAIAGFSEFGIATTVGSPLRSKTLMHFRVAPTAAFEFASCFEDVNVEFIFEPSGDESAMAPGR